MAFLRFGAIRSSFGPYACMYLLWSFGSHRPRQSRCWHPGSFSQLLRTSQRNRSSASSTCIRKLQIYGSSLRNSASFFCLFLSSFRHFYYSELLYGVLCICCSQLNSRQPIFRPIFFSAGSTMADSVSLPLYAVPYIVAVPLLLLVVVAVC